LHSRVSTAAAPGYGGPIAATKSIYLYNTNIAQHENGLDGNRNERILFIKQTTTIIALCRDSCLYIISYTVHSFEYCYVLLLFGTGGSRSERATGSTAIQSAMRRRSLKERRDVKVSLGSCRYLDLICLLSLFLSLESHLLSSLVTPPREERRKQEPPTTKIAFIIQSLSHPLMVLIKSLAPGPFAALLGLTRSRHARHCGHALFELCLGNLPELG
jgi:hypothetical protein